ncbi:MAG TPA: HdeD family acid-resistance protein [Anaerolineales bacterium]|nr:HdeD family acid-resistance protein [Anaerolineales bacterium]
MINTLAHNWWTLVLRGLAAILFGILAYVLPDITFTVLVLLFGAYALWDGVFALIGAVRAQGERRWILVLEGLVGIAAGLVTFFWPGAATLAILTIMAVWAIVTGVFEIIGAIRLRKEIEGEWFLLLSGLLSVLFGLALVIWPVAGLVAVTWMIGAYAIIFGILLIVLGFRLRNWSDTSFTPPTAKTAGVSK